MFYDEVSLIFSFIAATNSLSASSNLLLQEAVAAKAPYPPTGINQPERSEATGHRLRTSKDNGDKRCRTRL